MTLDDCLRLAQAAPSQVSIARLDIDAARLGVSNARAAYLPQTQWSNSFTYNSSSSYVALNGLREYVSLLSAAIEFDTNGRIRAEVARARAAQDAATASLSLTQRDLKRAVTTAYYRLLLTRNLVEAGRSVVTESESFEKRVKLMFAGGESARADVVKASAQSALLRQTLSNAELEAQIANQELASFWTRDVSAPLVIDDVTAKPIPAPEADAVGAPFMRRIEFNLLDAQRRGFQAEARRELAARLPQASMAFQYGIDSNAVAIRDRGSAVIVNLNIPIFDWYKARNASRQFQARAQQVEANRSIAERAYSREYETALVRVKRYYALIAQTAEQRTLAEEDLKLSRLRYEGGEGSALDVVTANAQLAQARSNFITNLTNYLNARVDLEVTAGR
jgi:outer membrane protein